MGKMSDDESEGGVQPGTRSALRRDQRRATNGGPEIGRGGGNGVAVENARVLPFAVAVANAKRICVWPQNIISRRRLWGLLEEPLSRWVVKITKVSERRSERIRFDIFVREGRLKRALKELRVLGRRFQWYVRRHVAYRRRVTLRRIGNQQLVADGEAGDGNGGHVELMGGVQEAVQNMEPIAIKLATWNIQSLAQKRPELGMYLRECGVHILALQETWRCMSGWPLCIKGYQVLEAIADREGESRNGLALVLKHGVAGHEVGANSPYVMVVRLRIGVEEWSVMNVYVPNVGAPRALALRHIRNAVQSELTRDLASKILIMGDWNMKSDKVGRMLTRWRVPLSVVRCVGNPATHRGPNRWASIDHMVVSAEGLPYINKCVVNRNLDLSDHWPLQAVIRGARVGTGQPANQAVVRGRISIDMPVLKQRSGAMLDDNRWTVLRELIDNDADVDIATEFEATLRDVVEDLGAIKPPPAEDAAPVYGLSGRAKRAIRRRREAYKSWVQTDAPNMQAPSWVEYTQLRKQAQREIRKSSSALWLRFITRGAKSLRDNDMKGFWGWAKQVTHRGKSGPSDFGPLATANDDTRLAYTSEEKLEQWHVHYQRLSDDVTGHSRDPQYWAEVLPGPIAPPMVGLNGDISWMELNRVLRIMRSGSAPGCDGIPPELYKMALENDQNEFPGTQFGLTLLTMCQWIWENSLVPDAWNEAWIVSILKKGDPKLMNNYRGISLIPVIVKIVTSIVTIRLRDTLEEANWFVKEQAGFRSHEECAGHVCSLYEILTRRKISGKKTYVAFIDIRKAYDTVPIECLLRKLELMGVDGKCLAFFRALYAHATIKVRTRYGLSDTVNLLRGLRQGCNASPLLFDVFINDILVECQAFGVRVLGLQDSREVGLMFADDIALICGNIANLERAIHCIQRWGNTFEMLFGVDKCGIIGFGTGAHRTLVEEQHRWVLDGQPIPIVREYTYLGVPFSRDLDLDRMASARAEKGRKCLNALRPVLGCANIPIAVRIRLIKAILIPTLTYGSELWGMQSTRCDRGQMVLGEALRLLVRLKRRCTITSAATLGLEFGIDPLHALAASARGRAFVKFRSLRTTIAGLMQTPPVARKATWVTGSARWLRRFCPEVLHANTQPHQVAAIVRPHICNRVIGKSITAVRYLEHGFDVTTSYLKSSCRYPEYTRGIHWLCRLRANAFWTGRAFVKIGWLPIRYRTECPFCGVVDEDDEGGETIEHLLMVCNRWNAQRQEYLSVLINEHRCDYVNLLGGSRENSVVDREHIIPLWLWDIEEQDNELVDGAAQDGNGEHGHITSPGYLQVAKFLQAVMPTRCAVLSQLLQTLRADADVFGMAVLQEDANEAPVAALDDDANAAGNAVDDLPVDIRVGEVAGVT